MAWNTRNNWPDIAELRIDDSATDSSFSTETAFRLELYTGDHELNIDDKRISFGFCKLTLKLSCDGSDISLGERYGDIVPVNDVTTKIAIQQDVSRKSRVSVAAGADSGNSISPVQASGSIGGEAAKAFNRTSETLRVTTSRHVTSKPNNKWEISSLDSKTALSAKYITKEDVLCFIKPKSNYNRIGLEAQLYAHKNDIVISSSDEKKSRFSLLNGENKNKERIFKILLGRLITDNNDSLDTKYYVPMSSLSSFNDEE